jgi:hypothetical protein
MADEDFVKMGLNFGIAKSFQITIIQILPILTTAGEVKALIRMFL